jgi:hypothetical protein
MLIGSDHPTKSPIGEGGGVPGRSSEEDRSTQRALQVGDFGEH